MKAERRLAWAKVDSKVGILTVVASPIGVVTVAFDTEHTGRVLAQVQERLNASYVRDSSTLSWFTPMVEQMRVQTAEYCAGVRQDFEVPLDMALLSGFRLDVIHAIQQIPYGEVRSYGDVAAMTGHHGAARAVGTACRMNPLLLVVPCHRVIKADGTIGGYTSGMHIKRQLLTIEGHEPFS